MKMKKYLLAISLSGMLAAGLTGCGTSGGSSSSFGGTTANVVASDAYVIALQTPAKMTLTDGTVIESTKVEPGGKIVFNIPKGKNPDGAKVYIPDDAIVDSNFNGVLDPTDQNIRTPLMTKYLTDQNIRTPLMTKYLTDNNGTEIVANPTTTSVLMDNPHISKEEFKKLESMDPVKLKENIIKSLIKSLKTGNTQSDIEVTQELKKAILNDGIADLNHIGVKIIKTLKTNYPNKVFDNQKILQTLNKNFDITTLLSDVNNESVSVDAFKAELLNKIQNATDLLKTYLTNNYDLTNNVMTQVEDVIAQGKTKVTKKIDAEIQIINTIKEKLQNNINNIGSNKEEIDNYAHKFAKLNILLSDGDVNSSEILDKLKTIKNISELNITTFESHIPENPAAINFIKKHKDKWKDSYDKIKDKSEELTEKNGTQMQNVYNNIEDKSEELTENSKTQVINNAEDIKKETEELLNNNSTMNNSEELNVNYSEENTVGTSSNTESNNTENNTTTE